MATHNAIITVAPRAPLTIARVPTIEPQGREILVRVEWVASSQLDLHQADGGLLVQHPQGLGSTAAGTVLKTGPNVKNLQVGDKVFGYTFEDNVKKAQQEFVTALETSFGKIPDGISLQEAVTIPDSVVTVFHTITADLSLELPWPRPETPTHAQANTPILIWGGASSCGQYAIQILHHWGYENILTAASSRHHERLHSLGARHTFDYRDADVVQKILAAALQDTGRAHIPYVFDCIASLSGSLRPVSEIVQAGTRVAVLLPVILRDSSVTEAPEYSMSAQDSVNWAEGAEIHGVRTHFYAKNDLYRESLQPTIIPKLLADGILRPNNQKVVEGETMLERAQKAMGMLRNKEVSGERLVWRVAESA